VQGLRCSVLNHHSIGLSFPHPAGEFILSLTEDAPCRQRFCDAGQFEALRSKLQRIFDSYGTVSFGIRSLTPQQAAGTALATEFKYAPNIL